MWYSFSFFGGVAALLASASLPAGSVVILLGLLAFVGGLWCGRSRLARAVCGACCGFLFAAYFARDYLAHRWPQNLTDERVIGSVVIDSIPAPLEGGWSFDGIVRIDTPERPPAGAPAAWGEEFRARLVSRDPEFRPHVGERWRLLLSLRSPRGRANPGAQDFERHQFREGVHALGAVLSSNLNRLIDTGHRPLDRLREQISEHIEARVTDRDAAALIAALAVGDTGRVSREQWRVFNATGTTHLVAISGMHVTLFAVIMFALARRVWGLCVMLGAASARGPLIQPLRRFCAWIASRPRETFAATFGFLAAAGYAALAGLSVPTERTLIMLGVWLLARSVARASHPFQPFALALLVVLLIDPFAPLSSGFWLSFAAMAAIILSATGRFIRRPLWREALAVQVIVSIALLPFTVALFGSIPLIGLPVNLVTIPAMSWVLVPTVLLALALLPLSTSASDAVLGVAEWMHNLGWPWLAAASDVPWGLIHASPPWWWYVLAVVTLLFAALPWPMLMRLAALACVVPLAASIERPLDAGSAEITALDVGEGTSVVVRTARHALVYGTGDSYGTDGRMADSVVVPFLRSAGIRAIDRLVIPRASPVAGAGVAALWAEMPVLETLTEEGAVDSASISCASVPNPWQWDGVTFALRAAGAGHACVLTVSTAGGEVRIPEGGAVALEGLRWVVVSGRRAQRSIAKYTRLHPEVEGAQVLATADQGAIRVRLDAGGPGAPEAYRASRRALWSDSP